METDKGILFINIYVEEYLFWLSCQDNIKNWVSSALYHDLNSLHPKWAGQQMIFLYSKQFAVFQYQQI